MTAADLALVLAAALVAGAVNAVAGGGTLLTFPALVASGLPAIAANATSTVALWPGGVASLWGYREDLPGLGPWALRIALPSLAGGAIGAWLLLHTPSERFDQLVPWLVLGATLLFLGQKRLLALLGKRLAREDDAVAAAPPAGVVAWQLLVGIYGGYFGAGIGILMLAAFGLAGLGQIHKMNALKAFGGLCMNVVAAAMFATSALVDWETAAVMAAGSLAGGYGGARLARLVGPRWVRGFVGAFGLGAAAWLFVRNLGAQP